MSELSQAINNYIESTTGRKQIQKVEDPSLRQEADARLARIMDVLVGVGLPPETIESSIGQDYSAKIIFGHQGSIDKAKIELIIQPVTPYLVFIKTLHPLVVEQRPVALMSPRLKEDLLGVLVPYFGAYAIPLPPVPPAVVEPVEQPVEPIEPLVEPIVEPVPPPVEPVAEKTEQEVEVEEAAKALPAKTRKKGHG